jgi:hypothetical protein
MKLRSSRFLTAARQVLVWLAPLALTLPRAPEAQAVTFNYAGVITNVSRGDYPPPSNMRVGTPFTASLFVDDVYQPGDSNADPTFGIYETRHDGTSAVQFSFNIAGDFYGADPQFIQPVLIRNQAAGDSVSMVGEVSNFCFIRYNFRDPAGAVLSSDAWTRDFLRSTWPEIEIGGRYLFYFSQFTEFTGIVTPVAAFIMKPHGSGGVGNLYLRPTGAPAVECRGSKPVGNHAMFFVFDRNITNATATVTSGVGSISGSPSFQNRIVTVFLSGVADQQYLTVRLTNVIDSAGQAVADASATVGFLIGDVNGDGMVNAGDVQQVRNLSGQTADVHTPASYRCDLNADGTINSGDNVIVRSSSGHMLLP